VDALPVEVRWVDAWQGVVRRAGERWWGGQQKLVFGSPRSPRLRPYSSPQSSQARRMIQAFPSGVVSEAVRW
jgi:hypothetical protein